VIATHSIKFGNFGSLIRKVTVNRNFSGSHPVIVV